MMKRIAAALCFVVIAIESVELSEVTGDILYALVEESNIQADKCYFSQDQHQVMVRLAWNQVTSLESDSCCMSCNVFSKTDGELCKHCVVRLLMVFLTMLTKGDDIGRPFIFTLSCSPSGENQACCSMCTPSLCHDDSRCALISILTGLDTVNCERVFKTITNFWTENLRVQTTAEGVESHLDLLRRVSPTLSNTFLALRSFVLYSSLNSIPTIGGKWIVKLIRAQDDIDR